MTLHLSTLWAFLLMGSATYATRATGYLLLGTRELSPRVQAVMDVAPGCVLISMIVPYFLTGRLTDLIALSFTIVAAMRGSLLVTVLVGVLSAGVLRAL